MNKTNIIIIKWIIKPVVLFIINGSCVVLIAIPKGRTVFTFTVAEHEFTLYGQNLLFRAGDRSSRKFKDKPFVDL